MLLRTPVKGAFVALLTLLATSTAFADKPQQWQFRVYLDDQPIGYHDFRLTPQGKDGHRLDIDARFDVKFLFFTAYRYRHQNTEVWSGRCLRWIESSTNDNGRQHRVIGSQTSDGFVLQSDQEPLITGECVRTFAYWDPAILKNDRLLNAQTGDLVEVEVAELGKESIEIRGKPVLASRYRLRSELAVIDLWYESGSKRWLALQTTTESGHQLNYLMN